MATEAEGKTKEVGPRPRGVRRLRRLSQAGHPRLLRPRLEEPAGQLHRAGDRLGTGDVDGGRFDPRRQRSQEGGAGRGRRGGAAARPALRAVGSAGGDPDRRGGGVRWAATWSRTRKRSPARSGVCRTLIADTRTQVRRDPGRLPRRPLRRRQPQPHGRRPAQALPRGARRPRRKPTLSARVGSSVSISDLRPPTENRTSRLERSTFSILPRPYSGWTMISPAL